MNEYITSDLGLATYLNTIGYIIKDTQLLTANKLNFIFESTVELERDVAAYFSLSGVAPARKLFEAYRSLRALTYQKTGNLRRGSIA